MKRINEIYLSVKFLKASFSKKSRINTLLQSLILSLGILIITVISAVVTGFQSSYINAIIALSSFNLQVSATSDKLKLEDVADYLEKNKRVFGTTIFLEEKALLVNPAGYSAPATIRALPSNLYYQDPSFRKELNIVQGVFNLEEGGLVLGDSLLSSLNVSLGEELNILLLGSALNAPVIKSKSAFQVKAAFHTGYYLLNEAQVFISKEAGQNLLTESPKILGVRLKKRGEERKVIAALKKEFGEEIAIKRAEELNSSFFRVLKMEKTFLLFLLYLVFLSCAFSVYNSTKKKTLENIDVSVLFNTLGLSYKEIRKIYFLEVLFLSILSVGTGVLLSFIIVKNIKVLFYLIGSIDYLSRVFQAFIQRREPATVLFNSMYTIYAKVTPIVEYGKLFILCLTSIIFIQLISALALKKTLKLNTATLLKEGEL